MVTALLMVAGIWLVVAVVVAWGIGKLPRDGREDYQEADNDHH